MKAKLVIAGEIHLKGSRKPVSGLLFEVELNDPAAKEALRKFVRETFGLEVDLRAFEVPQAPEKTQGVL